MVKHIILWTLKEMSDSEKESVKAGIKGGLEELPGGKTFCRRNVVRIVK